MIFQDLHSEVISFFEFNSESQLLVLLCLSLHNPDINRPSGEINFQSSYYHQNCLSSSALRLHCLSRSRIPGITKVPPCYHDRRYVFSKSRATSLPSHNPYNCPMDLLPGASPPKERLYLLSPAETAAMSEYIKTSLEVGIIRPSSSPAGAGFFFVSKKDVHW